MAKFKITVYLERPHKKIKTLGEFVVDVLDKDICGRDTFIYARTRLTDDKRIDGDKTLQHRGKYYPH